MSYVVSGISGAKIRSFTDLHAWQEGHKFVLLIYMLTKDFPKEERFGLASQLRRAVVSITSNIAEGFRRNSKQDKRQFYTVAISSLTEVQNQLVVARDVHFITQEKFQEAALQSVRVSKLISGLLRSAPGLRAA